MEYKIFSQKSYNIHTIKTDRFKVGRIEVFFRFEANAKKLPILSFLSGIMSDSSKDYPTQRKLAIQKENLYKCFYYSSLVRVGNVSSLMFSLDFINPSLINEKSYIDELIKFLFDMIKKPNVKNNEFDLEAFNIEKNDILLDIESINEDPVKMAINNALNVMDASSISSALKLGTKEDILKITRESLYDEYKYVISNSMVDIFVIGSLDMDKIVSLIKDNYHNIRINNYEFNYYVNNKLRKKALIKSDTSSFGQSQLTIIYNLVNLNQYEKEIVFPVFNYIFGSGGLTSKLYKYLREENGLCYRVSSMHFKYDNLLCILVSLGKDNIPKAIKLCDKALKEMCKKGFTENDLNDAKKNLKLSLEMNKNNEITLLNSIVFTSFTNSYSIDEKLCKIENVSVSDITTIAKKIKINTIYSLCEGENGKN